LLYLAVIPLGTDGVFTAVAEAAIDPVVVLTVKGEMLFELLFDVYKNLPVECIARATGVVPVGSDAGERELNVPAALILKPKSWFDCSATTYRKLFVGSTTIPTGA
jgi:hypothetical protein